jgi:hypothetical protein
MNAPVRGQAPPRLRPSRTLSGRVGWTCRFRAAAGPVSAGLRSPPWRKKRPFPGPAGRGTLGCRRHSGRTRCQPASRRDPLGSLGRSTAWSRPDRDQDRPWLAAGRHQAILFRGALVHRRAGDRGGDGRPLRAWPRGGRRRLVRRIHLAIGGAVRRDRDVAGSGLLSASAQAVRLPRPVPSFTRSRGNATCLAGRKWAARNSPGGSARTSTRLPDPAAKPALARGLTRSATCRVLSRVDRYASRPPAAVFVVTAA